MTNIVDTSAETVNAEFDAAEKEIGTESEALDANETNQAQEALEEAQKQAEIAVASGVIATTLKLSLSAFSGVSVDEETTKQAAESYAVLIIKYYPGGLFALLDRYKEEMAAVTSTFMLIKAVSDAKAKKAEEEEAEKTSKDSQQKPSDPAPQASTNSENTSSVPTAVFFNG